MLEPDKTFDIVADKNLSAEAAGNQSDNKLLEIDVVNHYSPIIFATILLLTIFAGAIFTFIVVDRQTREVMANALMASGQVEDVAKEYPVRVNPFTALKLEAKAVYVLDALTNEVIYERNARAQLPLASLTKLMTAIVAKETIPDEVVVQIGRRDILQDGDNGLLLGERWYLTDLIKFTLFSSSNDGASALAMAIGNVILEQNRDVAENENYRDNLSPERAFIKVMNDKAKTIGLSETFFLNESGLDETNYLSGAYGSARDSAFLLAYAIKNHSDLLIPTNEKEWEFLSADQNRHKVRNTNPYVISFPGVLGSKTGFTDLAGGNLVMAIDFSFNHPIIIAVLGSTETGRFSDMNKLTAAVAEYFYWQ
jgi:D-alanyl-D-alanine carboxypeptidase (penicillin-binding protein 5/6)